LAAITGGLLPANKNKKCRRCLRSGAITKGEYMPAGQAGRRTVARLTWRGLLVVACYAAAGSVTVFGHAADVELGRYLSAECMTCHGSARADGAIPDIFGMAETTFAEVVKAYREKRMANPVMQTIASRLSDEEIAALAAYFATAKKQQ
jgi:cytochrome c